jgi:hypothetical protein
MPRGKLGQKVTFSIEVSFDEKIAGWIKAPVHTNDTVAKMLAHRGHPELADRVLKANKVRSAYTVLRHSPKRKHDRTRLLIPKLAAADNAFDAYADIGGQAPTITDGYAKVDIVDRPYRVGIAHFVGYNPGEMEVPLTFDSIRDTTGTGAAQGDDIEDACALLELMGGRGNFHGSSVGPPPIIRVGVYTGGAHSKVIPLIPANWQWSTENAAAPVWRVAGLEWDRSPLRNSAGNRIRQNVTVTLKEHILAHAAQRSAATRAKSGGSKAAPKKR